MFHLGVLLADADDLGGAHAWYTKAADASQTQATFNWRTPPRWTLAGARTVRRPISGP